MTAESANTCIPEWHGPEPGTVGQSLEAVEPGVANAVYPPAGGLRPNRPNCRRSLGTRFQPGAWLGLGVGGEAGSATSGTLSGIARSQRSSTTQIRIGDLTKAVGGSGTGCISQT